jgi:hypothetical protein
VAALVVTGNVTPATALAARARLVGAGPWRSGAMHPSAQVLDQALTLPAPQRRWRLMG